MRLADPRPDRLAAQAAGEDRGVGHVSANRPRREERLAEAGNISDMLTMSLRRAIAVLTGTVILLLPAGALASGSVGSYEQVAWVRRAASNFVGDELRGDGAGACSILNAPLRATRNHVTCRQRLNARLATLLRRRGAREALRAEARAIRSARVVVHGDSASIDLPSPLLDGPNRFLWTENCWMLER
jgi:hypothetical protein